MDIITLKENLQHHVEIFCQGHPGVDVKIKIESIDKTESLGIGQGVRHSPNSIVEITIKTKERTHVPK